MSQYSSLISSQNREELLHSEELGSYQGEWIMFSFKDGKYLYRQGGYGSCSGCDDYESTFGYGSPPIIDSKEVKDFVNKYQPDKVFTGEELRTFATENPTLYGFIPVSAHSYHEEGYDQAIIEGLKECLLHFERAIIDMDTNIAQEIQTKGFYTKPLGFMYDRFKEVSDLEEQVRVFPSYYSPTGYHIVTGLLRIDDDKPGDNSLWLPLDSQELPDIESVQKFLHSKQSIYVSS